MRVEKVKPDPLNLSVKTGAGSMKQSLFDAFPHGRAFLFLQLNICKFAGGLEANDVRTG